MKVKKLIEKLNKLDPESIVVLQKDSEGNGYSPLYGVDGNAVYVPESTWGGEVYDLSWSADDACMDEAEWEKMKSKKRCVVLTPTN